MTAQTPTIVMQYLLNASAQAALLAGVIGLVLLVMRNQIAPRWRHRLWWLVVLRMALPALPGSPVSLYQWLPDAAARQHVPTPTTAATATPVAIPEAAQSDAAVAANLPSHPPPPPEAAPSSERPWPPPLMVDTPPAAEERPPVLPDSYRPSAAAANPIPHLATQDAGTIGPAPQRTARHWAWLAAFIVWLGVGAAIVLRTILGYLALRRRAQRDTTRACERASHLLQETARLLGIKRPPVLKESAAVPGPTLLGVYRPTLLIPPGLTETLDDHELGLVFRHELCHLRGRDNLANWLLVLLQATHWFNPLAWWAIAQLRAQRELARDAQTVLPRPADTPYHATHDRARQYAEALLAVARFSANRHHAAPCIPSPVTSAAVRDRKHLSRRLAMLEHADRFRLRHSLLACMLLVVLGVTGLTVAHGQSEDVQAAPSDEPAAQAAQPADTDDVHSALEGSDVSAEEDAAARAARQIVSLAWENTSFEDAIADLEQQTGLRITFDPVIQEAIDELAPSQPHLSTTLARMPLESALRLALDLLPGERLREAFPPVDARWTLEDDILHLALETGEIRVYDIRDLLVVKQPDPAEAPWSDDKIEEVRQDCLQQVMDLFKKTIGQPRHWSDEYADTDFGGMIRELNGNFIVKTTPTNHRDILSLLERLRETRGWMISFEVKLLLLDDATFQEVFSEDILVERWGGSRFHSVHPGRRGAHVPGDTDADVDAVINPQRSDLFYGFVGGAFPSNDQIAALLEHAAEAGRRNYVFDLPRVTTFNGQSAYAVLQGQRPFISGFAETAGEGNPPDADAAAEPVLSVSEVGALFLLRGTLSADRSFVTLTTVLEIAGETGAPLRLPAPQAEGAEPGYAELPQIDYRKMQTTLSMEDQLCMLGVGPEIRGKISGDDPAEYTDTRRIVLLIRPTIIEQQEQEIEFEGLLPESEAEPE